jgi:hypothetical protein
MQSHSVPYDKQLVGRLLNLRGKCILNRASNYAGNMNVDQALNTYTEYESMVYKRTKFKMEEISAWKYSHKWLNNNSSLKKSANN